jgi:hypothetical protein
MKKMKKLFVAAIVSFFLISCGAKNALKFNEKIVVIQNNLIVKINMAPIDLEGNNNVSNLNMVRDFAKEKMEELKALKAPSDGEDYKNAMLNNLQSVHNLYDYALKLTDPKLTDAEKSKVGAELTAMYAKATVVENKVMQEQRKFAKKYNLELK